MKKKTFWCISEQEKKSDFGTLRIRNEVIASIAATAAAEVDGVAKMGKNILSSIKGLLSKKIYCQGVYVEIDEENEVKITAYIVAKYGTDLAWLASNVQANMRSVLEKMTGIIPSEVNVVIQGVRTTENEVK